jgi:DNA-3-methyladenine glycosylase II
VKTRSFVLDLGSPIDFQASLEMFRRSGDDLLDRWNGHWLLRTIRFDGRSLPYACRPVPETSKLEVLLDVDIDPHEVLSIIERSFHRVTPGFLSLCERDDVLGRLASTYPGFRPPLHPELLVALVRAISAQQVNLRWAAIVRGRIAEKFGDRHDLDGRFVYSLDPNRLAELEPADIRALQLTTRKSEYVINMARAIVSGELCYENLNAAADDDVIARITAIRGLGLWTAEWILARTLGRPRVSAGDLGVRKAVGKAYFNGRMPSIDEVRSATAHWGEAAALAQELLLHAQHQKTLS